jgi:hypothetical protein
VRGIASLIVAFCLLAAGGVRARDPVGRDDRAPQLLAAGHALAASLAPRRDGGAPEQRLAAFTVPAVPALPSPPRAAAAVSDARPHGFAQTQLPARSARGPPCG